MTRTRTGPTAPRSRHHPALRPPAHGTSLTLVLGGARSGKSRHAETLAEGCAGRCVYLATAEPRDDEMAERIGLHRARRGARWETVEAALDLPAAIVRHTASDCCLLVDCLTLWLSNLMEAGRDIEAETAHLTAALAGRRGPAVLVSNEIGFGIVPDNALARAFRDHAGWLNQAVAAMAGTVVLVVAGVPLAVKDASRPQPVAPA